MRKKNDHVTLESLSAQLSRVEAMMRELSREAAGGKTDEVLNLAQAAKYLQMKPERLREACRGERIAFVRHNRR